MSASDLHDKNAILARRALFVASALAGLTRTSVAAADEDDEDPPPACPAPPSDELRTAARSLLDEGVQLLREGAFAEASERLRNAYRLYPHRNVVIAAIQADEGRGALVDAFELGTMHVRCFGPDPEIEEKLQALAAATGLVVVGFEVPVPTEVLVDERLVSAREARRGVRVLPGRHTVRVARDGAALTQAVEVAAGQRSEVRFGPLPPPMPCLQPMPCLEPPPPPGPAETLLRLQGGVAPIVGLAPAGEPTVVGGAGGHFEVAVQPASGLWITPGLFGAALAAADVRDILMGGGVDVEYRPVDAFGFGVGVAGGYVVASPDPAQRLQSGGFFGPVVVPASIFAGPFYLEARVPLWFADVAAEGGGTKLGLGLVAPQVVVGVGGAVLERDRPVQMAGTAPPSVE